MKAGSARCSAFSRRSRRTTTFSRSMPTTTFRPRSWSESPHRSEDAGSPRNGGFRGVFTTSRRRSWSGSPHRSEEAGNLYPAGPMSSNPGVALYLGIDPGLASTGWGVLDGGGRVVASGTVKTAPGPDGPRLVAIVQAVEDLLARHPVSEAALEELFMGRNRTSLIGVAQARGAILFALQRAG